MTAARPDYCAIPDEGQPGSDGPCPACGATISGDDPVRGVCQARHNGPPPRAPTPAPRAVQPDLLAALVPTAEAAD
jgi:hypothetical protein